MRSMNLKLLHVLGSATALLPFVGFQDRRYIVSPPSPRRAPVKRVRLSKNPDPHNGMKECARRVRQIAAGQLRIENGLIES